MGQDSLVIIVGIVALLLLVWNFTISAKIMNYLKKHGEKVNPATMHFKIFDNANKYKQITRNETGEVGTLYNPFLVSFILFAFVLFYGIIMVAI